MFSLHATVTADEVRVEHLVVVGAGGLAGEVRRGRGVRVRAVVTGGVAGLWSVSCGLGSALCAMSVRNGVSKCRTFAGTGTGAWPCRPRRGRSWSRTGAVRARAGDELAVRVDGDHRDVE